FSCEGTRAVDGPPANKKPGVGTPNGGGHLATFLASGQRVSRKRRDTGEPSCCVYRRSGETTAETTWRSIARVTTVSNRCARAVRRWNGLGRRGRHSQRGLLYHPVARLSSAALLSRAFSCFNH